MGRKDAVRMDSERTEQRQRALRKIKALYWIAAALFIAIGFLNRAEHSPLGETVGFALAGLFTLLAVLMMFVRLAPESETEDPAFPQNENHRMNPKVILLRLRIFFALALAILLLLGWMKDNHLAWFAHKSASEPIGRQRK